MNLFVYGFKAIRKGIEMIMVPFYSPWARLVFFLNGVKCGRMLTVRGFLQVHVTMRGKVEIGDQCSINSGRYHNVIGRQQPVIFWVEGEMKIGNHVGISSTAIICKHRILIGDHVMIGGNTVIYDTDFHSLDSSIRSNPGLDQQHAGVGTVVIGNHAFIGAHSTILKGVHIGENAIIGAGSVVTGNVPANEIWAGNPARFIRKTD